MAKTLIVPVSTLQPHPENENIYGEIRADQKLIDSIRVSGLIQPIVVTKEDEHGKRTIVAGHRRHDAMIQLGVADVRVEEHEYESDEHLIQALVGSNQQRDKTAEDVSREFKIMTGANVLLSEDKYSSSYNDVPTEELADRLGRSVSAVQKLEFIYKPSVREKALKRLEKAGGTEADIHKVETYWDRAREKHDKNELGTKPAVEMIKAYLKRVQKEVGKRGGFKSAQESPAKQEMSTTEYRQRADGFIHVSTISIDGSSYAVGMYKPNGIPVPLPAIDLTPRGSVDEPNIATCEWSLVAKGQYLEPAIPEFD